MSCIYLYILNVTATVTLRENLDLLRFAIVANRMKIHVYTYSKDGKCHICNDSPMSKCGIYHFFATGINMYLHRISHTSKHEQCNRH